MTRKEQIKEQLKELPKDTFDSVADYVTYCAGFYDGVAWADAEHPANIWKDAQGVFTDGCYDEKNPSDKVEPKTLNADKVIAWLVGNIIDFEDYVRAFKQDFGL